jgi:predicted O-methyltransferase YrrM
MRSLRGQAELLVNLLRSKPPPTVMFVYLATLAGKFVRSIRAGPEKGELQRDLDREGVYTTRWFDGHVDEWMRIFRSQRLQDRPIRALEIGSWEGRSTVFLLRHLPMANVTAVDTWEGSHEHIGDPRLTRIEVLFDANVARYGARLNKVKSTSADFFRKHAASAPFEFIYVDGSHDADDVMADALGAFDLLVPGGIMIFDDYVWKRNPDPRKRPAVAINGFLRMMRGRYRILSVTTQMIVKKLA